MHPGMLPLNEFRVEGEREKCGCTLQVDPPSKPIIMKPFTRGPLNLEYEYMLTARETSRGINGPFPFDDVLKNPAVLMTRDMQKRIMQQFL